jgi:hypothetical protein
MNIYLFLLCNEVADIFVGGYFLYCGDGAKAAQWGHIP